MTRTELTLREYESRTVALSPLAIRHLKDVAGPRLGVAIGAEPGTYELTASQWVGSIITPEVAILVRPKIPLHNLFALLDVGLPEEAWSTERFGFGAEHHLLPAFAQVFARAAEHALARGTRRDYRALRERVPALRGRIDFPEQLRQPAIEIPIACEFDEYTADIYENQVLLAAIRLLLRVPGVRPHMRRRLLALLARLEDVTDVWVDPATIGAIPITRLNRHYGPALRLAQLVLQNLTLVDRIGTADSSAFMVDMNVLFQQWVTDRLRRHLRGVMTVEAEPPWTLDYDRRIGMRPDLVFRRDGRAAGIADVKYKLVDTGLGRTGDYYQLLAYTTVSALPEGVLIYCQGDGSPVSDEVVVRHAAKRLLTYQLDLRGRPIDVERSARVLADWLART